MNASSSLILNVSLRLSLAVLLIGGCAANPPMTAAPLAEGASSQTQRDVANGYQLLATVTPAPLPPAWSAKGQIRIRRWLLSLFRPTYDVLVDGKVVGVIERSSFASTSTWQLRDAKRVTQGRLEQAPSAAGFLATIKDPAGTVVGRVSQEVKLAFTGSSVNFKVMRADGAVVLRTGAAVFTSPASVDLFDAGPTRIGLFVPAWFSAGQARSMDLFTAIDGRLMLAFMAAQLDLGARRDRLAR